MSQTDNYEEKYLKLLDQFNQYRQRINTEKQKQLAELQKYRSQIDKTYKQIEKKFESKLQEERVQFDKKIKKMQQIQRMRQQETSSLLNKKNKFIEQLKKKLIQSDREKNQIIEQNTHMLYDLAQDIANTEQIVGPHKNSYSQLAKLYQFVLQENNTLKKQLRKQETKKRQELYLSQESKINHKQTQKATPLIPYPDKKKQKSTDQSKTHNESIKNKSTHYTNKKDRQKESASKRS